MNVVHYDQIPSNAVVRDYQFPAGDILVYGIGISEGGNQFRFKGCDERIYSDTQFPETVLVSVIGKSPLHIIQGHPDIDARYTADDRIVAARWYPDAEVTGFDVVMAR